MFSVSFYSRKIFDIKNISDKKETNETEFGADCRWADIRTLSSIILFDLFLIYFTVCVFLNHKNIKFFHEKSKLQLVCPVNTSTNRMDETSAAAMLEEELLLVLLVLLVHFTGNRIRGSKPENMFPVPAGLTG